MPDPEVPSVAPSEPNPSRRRPLDRLKAVFGRRRPPEVQPEQRETALRVDGIRDRVRDSARSVVDGSLKREVDAAKNRYGKTHAEYHKDILFEPPVGTEVAPSDDVASGEGTEDTGKHYARVHLVRDGRPHPIVFVVGGNKERLYDPNPGDPASLVYGARHTFEQVSRTGKFHVVQLKVGNVLRDRVRNSPAVARAHIDNVVEDALNKRGVFEGIDISEVRFFGYSYGADTARQLAENIPPGLRVTKAAYIDAIRAGSKFPPRAMRSGGARPEAYHNVYQRNDVVIAGGALEARDGRPADRNVDATPIKVARKSVRHMGLTNAQEPEIRDGVYKPTLDFLMADA